MGKNSMFLKNLFNSTNYRLQRTKEYVLVLVQCHDGIIRNSINVFLRLTLVFDSCKTTQIYLVCDNRIKTCTGLEPKPNILTCNIHGKPMIMDTTHTARTRSSLRGSNFFRPADIWSSRLVTITSTLPNCHKISKFITTSMSLFFCAHCSHLYTIIVLNSTLA